MILQLRRLATHLGLWITIIFLVGGIVAILVGYEWEGLVLTDAPASLIQGNLTARAMLNTHPLVQTGSPEIDQLAGVLNMIATQLQESAKEFNIATDEPCQHIFYVGADPYLEGCTCGQMMGQVLDGHGQVVVLVEAFPQTSQQLRCKGFEMRYPGTGAVTAFA